MTLDDIITAFASLTRDSVVIGYSSKPGEVAQVEWLNDACLRQYGWTFEEVIGQSVHITFHSDYLDDVAKEITDQISTGANEFQVEALCARADGSTFWGQHQVAFLPRDENGGRYSFAVIRDISKLKSRERDADKAVSERETLLAEVEAAWSRLNLAIESFDTPMGIWDKDMRLVVCNSAFGPRLMGRDIPSNPNIKFEDFVRIAAYSGQFQDAIGDEEAWIAGATKGVETRKLDDVTRYADGVVLHAKSHLSPNGDMIVHNYDVTEVEARKRELTAKNAELEAARQDALRRAHLDDLTDLGNRRALQAARRKMEHRRALDGVDIAVLQIDLDRFKQINDTMGHSAGDHVLKVVADRLRALVGDKDHLTRIGGDEFVILLYGTDALFRARGLGRRVVEALSHPVTYRDSALRIGASVGIAATPFSGAKDLLVHADIALYRAKSAGRGQVSIFDRIDLEEMHRAKTIADDLFLGFETGAFVPVYQPQVCARTGQVVGAEALARWNHPERGLLAPVHFLKDAAELNILADIDAAIFETAIAECAATFDGEQPPDLSFNASEDRLTGQHFESLLSGARGYRGKVAIELLETIFFENAGDAFLFQLDRLREAGISVELDDFGSGRASIVALEQIAPDRLKIDRRLVAPVAVSERSARLVASIIDIGKALGIKITAEGVETEAQATVLRELGCDRLQGYHFGHPMPLADLCDLIDEPVPRPARVLKG